MVTNRWSPIIRFGSIEPDGIMNGAKTKLRTNRVTTNRMMRKRARLHQLSGRFSVAAGAGLADGRDQNQRVDCRIVDVVSMRSRA